MLQYELVQAGTHKNNRYLYTHCTVFIKKIQYSILNSLHKAHALNLKISFLSYKSKSIDNFCITELHIHVVSNFHFIF